MLTKSDSIANYLRRHEQFLHQILSHYAIEAPKLREAMIYSVFPGGKRLRALLVYLLGEALEVEVAALDVMAAAVELTHCYSLIHDDLPAMDNDDMRRGKPSLHRAFDEATAILAGDALQELPIEILLNQLPNYLPAAQVLDVAKALLNGSGVQGMLSGQCFDLAELTNPTLEEVRLRYIHSLKTGQLFLACGNMPLATVSQPIPAHMDAVRNYTALLGVVFQMQDDYLDYYSQQTHGKGRASDKDNEKMTYAKLYSKKDLQNLINQNYQLAIQALSCFGKKAETLMQMTESLQQRSL